MSSQDGRRSTMEKPLKGVVLCCTSISPEQRTHMAEAAMQMGAEHKLDLTADVTHLMVGDSSTLKYKYVAREREDVKVLQLDWVEAIRQAWMRGDDVNIEALEDEFRLPPFAGLRMCVTGFEDLTFRAQLQEMISANGGEYRGDLTKEVTHLIAYAAEGKKYQYATQWEVKVVGLKWLKDSLGRGMILEEALYHPTIPVDKQGAGAWNRQARPQLPLSKRIWDDETAADVPRKLRRTASMKLGSQSEGLWSEIVSGPQGKEAATHEDLQTSKSMPVRKPVGSELRSFVTDSAVMEDDRRNPTIRASGGVDQQRNRVGIFPNFGFFLYGFIRKQTAILREHILSNDGEIFDSLTDLNLNAGPNVSRTFLVIPHSHPFSDIPPVSDLRYPPEIVTDMWAERCLQSKQFFEPREHVLSRPIPKFPIPGFERLIINSTGFANIDLLHVSKVVPLLGATYDQVLKIGTSVLLCNSSKAGGDKLRHAREWRIPAVSIDWLWTCLRTGKTQAFHPFLIKQIESPKGVISAQNITISARRPEPVSAEVLEDSARKEPHGESAHHAKEDGPQKSSSNGNDENETSNASSAKLNPEEGISKRPRDKEGGSELHNLKEGAGIDPSADTNRHEPDDSCDNDTVQPEVGLPLQDISTNSPPKSETVMSRGKGRMFRRFDSRSSMADKDGRTLSAPETTSAGKTMYVPPGPDLISGAIKELLGKSKARIPPSASSNSPSKKKRLLGRALSNMSNSSREGSHVRASRASSIDSVNTDGLGSIILDDASRSRRDSLGAAGRGSFTGRACAVERGVGKSSFDLGDAAMYREEYPEEEEPPPMTQLGYENPDDAVALREVLAERRRNRTRTGQEDVKPANSKEEKRIKDDMTIAPTGWGNGRRTRQKVKSP